MTKRIIAVLMAVLFGLAVISLPAVAKRTVGSGNGDTQGGSESNPDGGGVDKPYPADGQPARSQGESDWDGNNGCGNDDDREDDNNGWCGKKPTNESSKEASKKNGTHNGDRKKSSKGTENSVKGANHAADDNGIRGAAGNLAPAGAVVAANNSRVLGTTFTRNPQSTVQSTVLGGSEVLGLRIARGESLPVTGSDMTAPLVVAAVLILSGALMLRRRKAKIAS
ncbi:MAG: LPXTG cell wall anchor domain-containing protein [Actinomycetota bacterium]